MKEGYSAGRKTIRRCGEHRLDEAPSVSALGHSVSPEKARVDVQVGRHRVVKPRGISGRVFHVPVPRIAIDVCSEAVGINHEQAVRPVQARIREGRGPPDIVGLACQGDKAILIYLRTVPSVRPCCPAIEESQLCRAANEATFSYCAPVLGI